MKIKFLSLIIAVFLGISTLKSQNIGAKLSYNYANVVGDLNEGFKMKPLHGFLAGAFVEFPLGDGFSLQPEAIYTRQGAKLKFEGASQMLESDFTTDYIKIPVQAKINIDKLSLFVAPELGVLIQKPDVVLGEQRLDSKAFNGTSFAINFGVSYWFASRWGVELRYSRGMTSILDQNNASVRQMNVGVDNNFRNSDFSLGINFILIKDRKARIDRLFNTPK